jgi:hypothetical protein
MLVKNIIATFAIAGLAIAMPTEDFEERDTTACRTAHGWCCTSAVSSLNLFFVKGAGSGCVPANPNGKDCGSSSPKKLVNLCCSGNQIVVRYY